VPLYSYGYTCTGRFVSLPAHGLMVHRLFSEPPREDQFCSLFAAAVPVHRCPRQVLFFYTLLQTTCLFLACSPSCLGMFFHCLAAPASCPSFFFPTYQNVLLYTTVLAERVAACGNKLSAFPSSLLAPSSAVLLTATSWALLPASLVKQPHGGRNESLKLLFIKQDRLLEAEAKFFCLLWVNEERNRPSQTH